MLRPPLEGGPRNAASSQLYAGSLSLQEMGRREKTLAGMGSSRKEVRLGRSLGGVGGRENHLAGGGRLVASENGEKQKE